MTSQFSSSNPFRRKVAATPETPNVDEKTAPSYSNSVRASNTELTRDISQPVKKVRHVRVQSPPPPSSPEALSIAAQRPPTPVPKGTLDDDSRIDPFESSEHGSPDQDSRPNGLQNVPPNPFAKTLGTSQPTEPLSKTSPNTQHVHGSGRASLDVDAFKRLLMTGHSGRPVASGTPPHSNYHSIIPDGTSTDTSSVSRQSIFEPIQEAHAESPRTSHELSEQENERYNSVQDLSTGRKKPAPPSSRHGKLIKLELRDDPVQIKDSPRPSSSSSKVSQQFSYPSSSPQTRSQTDLNKPLPAAPRRFSNESNHEDRESIFDKEAAGKIPEPPSPTSSISRKIPPTPPIARRHSQLVSNTRNRSDSGRLSPRVEEEAAIPTSPDSGRERSSSNSSIAPAPPPSRRPGSLRSPAQVPPLSSPSAPVDGWVTSPKMAPPPPPSRSLSSRKPSRPASIRSMESQKETQKDPLKRSAAPPPPPPRHRASSRNSVDNPVLSPSTVSAGDSFRRSVDSSRRTSDVQAPPETANPETLTPKGPDILADLSALQREVEAAMAQQRNVS